jgi:serine/threonine protein kinase
MSKDMFKMLVPSKSDARQLLRQSTDDLDEDCSRFDFGILPNLTVTSPNTFEIEDKQCTVIAELGRGEFGIVLEAIDQHGLSVAVKFMFGEDQAAQRSELSMQYWLSCMLKEKPPPTGAALVPEIYTIANYQKGRQCLELIGDQATSCIVGVMEMVGSELSELVKNSIGNAKKAPIVRQVLKDVAMTLLHVNALSVRPAFVHGDLHESNVMYKQREDGTYQFYILDLGYGELKQHGVLKQPTDFYQNRAQTTNGFRNIGSVGNDLCTLCFSIAGQFSSSNINLPQLWKPISDILKLKQNEESLGLEIQHHFLNRKSDFFLGCKSYDKKWPLQYQDEDGTSKPLLLAHALCYDDGDADPDIAEIFEPGHFLATYITPYESSLGCAIA